MLGKSHANIDDIDNISDIFDNMRYQMNSMCHTSRYFPNFVPLIILYGNKETYRADYGFCADGAYLYDSRSGIS